METRCQSPGLARFALDRTGRKSPADVIAALRVRDIYRGDAVESGACVLQRKTPTSGKVEIAVPTKGGKFDRSYAALLR